MIEDLLDTNLHALSLQDRSSAARISSARSSPRVRIRPARNGMPVPHLVDEGHEYPLHSMFDPSKNPVPQDVADGFVVVFGLGGGYHVVPLLETPRTSRILIIEREVSMVRSFMESVDMSAVLSDPRVKLEICGDAGAVEGIILSMYVPAVDGGLRTLPLRPFVERHPGFYRAAAEAVRGAIEKTTGDYSVQAHFGRRWFVNILSNLEKAEGVPGELRQADTAAVVAAGPSLEYQIEEIASLPGEVSIIATDTSLPYLLHAGIRPDAAISIDCQHVSYHHFLGGYPYGVPLVADLASPPGVTRNANQLVFVAGGHPLAAYVSAHWGPFPSIDTSGGNVTHAAVSLAENLGASEIILYGADFSYPDGKLYARETYLYRYFRAREDRFRNLDTSFFAFMIRNGSLESYRSGGRTLYTTSSMRLYRERLESLSAVIGSRIRAARGIGADISLRYGVPRRSRINPFSNRTARTGRRSFLERYRDALSDLALPAPPARVDLRSMPPGERELWTTLLPSAAVTRRIADPETSGSQRILLETRDWAVEAVGRILYGRETDSLR